MDRVKMCPMADILLRGTLLVDLSEQGVQCIIGTDAEDMM